jgi:hypothetical protein
MDKLKTGLPTDSHPARIPMKCNVDHTNLSLASLHTLEMHCWDRCNTNINNTPKNSKAKKYPEKWVEKPYRSGHWYIVVRL